MEFNYQNPLTLISTLPTSFNPKPKRKRTTKPKLTPKTDTSITRPCTECGKKFWSWKALFGHMRCHPERKWRGINPPENLRRTNSEDYSSAVTDEEHEVATCLLLLANGPTFQSVSVTTVNQVAECSSERSQVFECSSCKKVFGSHQALGGHRASHKNVKGCFAVKRNWEDWDEKEEELGEGHKCNICWRVFSSGQALGGHMRCHWDPHGGGGGGISPVRVCGNAGMGFDLNLPVHDELDLDLRLSKLRGLG